MNAPAAAGLTVLAAYLIGAIPFGYLVARGRGVDILHQGSGNIGATNVGRVLGGRFGLLVFLFDFAKGALPAAVGLWLTAHDGGLQSAFGPGGLGVAAGLAAILGHLFPVYLRFRGGKGVATGAGVVAVLLPLPALGALVTWVVVLCASRYVSLASLSAATVLCVLRLAVTPEPFAPENRILTLFCGVAMGLVFLRHRANLARLAHGTENRLRETAAMLLLTKIIHVLALGLWFGSIVFFILAALVIFRTFQSLGEAGADRPAWLPSDFDKEKGTQLAGVAVSPLFDMYFPLQAVCGLLAIATATGLAWSGMPAGAGLPRARLAVLLLALVTVFAGWPLASYVGRLRLERYSADPAVAASARAAFGTWHTYSLLLNFATLLLVAVALGLAAHLPSTEDAVPPSETSVRF
jgi:acyl-phosphate glycerol 3-phosphate acyltransferase